MARKNAYGKIILSAGEISSYTVCPEAWNLKVIQSVQPMYSESVTKGKELHQEWSVNFDEAMYFTRSIKLIIGLIIASLFFAFVHFLLSSGAVTLTP